MDYLKAIDVAHAKRVVDQGGLLIDLRPIDEYLGRHVRGSIPLLFESGPGLGGRARDLLPLDARLVILGDDTSPLDESADSFRGKGFDVAGYVDHGEDIWPARDLASTGVVAVEDWKGRVLNVADPGVIAPEGAPFIPAERLWQRTDDFEPRAPLGILAGWGVRAATAIGILERLGFDELVMVRTRPAGARPPMAGPEVFRVG